MAESGTPKLLAPSERSLLDVIDNLLNQGVVVSGDAMLGVADVDLVYLKLTALLCAADRVLPMRRAPARKKR